MKKKILLISLLIFACWIGYEKYLAPTRIALVNFADYQYAKFLQANTNPFIRLSSIPLDKLHSVKRFDAVYIFAHGKTLSEEQRGHIKNAIKNGVPVYSHAATSDENDITSLTGNQLKSVKNYLSYGGLKNYKNLLNYTRRTLDGKKLFTSTVSEPHTIPDDTFFHISDENYFESYEQYQQFYVQSGLYKENAPRVAVITSTAGPRNSNREHIDALISALENKEINVYPIDGFLKRLDFLKEINPNLVIYFPHGRLAIGRGDEAVAWLKEQNIPLIAPLNILVPYEDWMADQRGMIGGEMGQNIVVPELDGSTNPRVLTAQFKNENGLYVFKAITDRLEKCVSLVHNWLTLQTKPNAEKKVAIYYIKAPGLNSLVAGGMNVADSLLNVLRSLKDAGYTTGELPQTAEEFSARINKEGPVLGIYAQGTIEKFINEGNPELITVDEYKQWFYSDIPAERLNEVIDTYGPPPGKYLNVTRNGAQYLAIPRVQFGNVVLLPILPPAYGENEYNLLHGANKAATHTYIASYLWSRHRFNADAIIHFGTHGSLEFTPGKQVALSHYDWADNLIGDIPHHYVYVINNVGEAMMAKRRIYATMISHLTPPFMKTELYGDFSLLHDKLHALLNVEDKMLKEEHEKSLFDLAIKTDVHIDLSLIDRRFTRLTQEGVERITEYSRTIPDAQLTALQQSVVNAPAAEQQFQSEKNLLEYISANKTVAEASGILSSQYLRFSEEGIMKLHNHIHAVEAEKVIRGFHTFGTPYDQTDIYETALLMALDPVMYSMAAMDILTGKTTDAAYENAHEFNALYGTHAREYLNAILQGTAQPDSLIDPADSAFLEKWEQENKTLSEEEWLLSMFQLGTGNEKQAQAEQPFQKEHVASLVLAIASDPEKKKAVLEMQNETKFNKSSALLDPVTRDKTQKIAQLIPAMKKQIDLLVQPDMMSLLETMQNTQAREYTFELLKDTHFEARIQAEKQQKERELTAQLLSEPYTSDLFLTQQPEKLKTALNQWDTQTLETFAGHLESYIGNTALADAITQTGTGNAKAVGAILRSDQATSFIKNTINGARARIAEIRGKEAERAQAIRTYRDALRSVKQYVADLQGSAAMELQALLNGLNGGYTAPSSGGDAIINPSAIPTGKNIYSIDAERTPTKEAWKTAQKLVGQLFESSLYSKGNYPEKVAFSLWGGEFIRGEGVNIAQILYLLGVEPVWNSRGRVYDVRLIPTETLGRPRIDVFVQTSGQFRDLAASRIYLIEKAIRIASEAQGTESFPNYVRRGTGAAEKVLKQKGFSPEEARTFSTVRVFGGINGQYGTGIMPLVEDGDAWENDSQIATQYIENMGAMYTKGRWSVYAPGMFEAALQHTDTVMHPRSSNMTGPLSLDHTYEFMGGLNAAIRSVTGNDPASYFSDLRNKYNATVQGVTQAIWIEARSTIYNPVFIDEMLKEGASGAEEFAETFRNTFGWNVMKPSAVDEALWNTLYDVYIDDIHELNIIDRFKDVNPYALQEMTAVMLETVRKGYWKPSEEMIKTIANLHTSLVSEYQAGCSGFVCDNIKLQQMIANIADPTLAQQYTEKINETTFSSASQQQEGMTLKEETVTVEKVKEMIKDSLSAALIVLGIICVFIITVILGIRRRRLTA